MDQAEPGAAVGQLAMTAVDLVPVLEHSDDRLPLPAQQAVQRVPAGRPVLQLPGGAALSPAGRPHVVQAQQHARLPDRPAAPSHGVIDQVQQAGLDRCLHRAGTGPAVRPSRIFPGAGAKRPPAR